MALTYTLDEIRDNLDLFADFEEVNSVSRARSYITWANRWLARMVDSGGNGGSNLSVQKQLVLELVKRARAFVQASDTSSTSASSVRFLSVDRMR